MNILHVVGSYYPSDWYGGPIATTRALCQKLVDLGENVRVLTTDANGPTRLPMPFRGPYKSDREEVYYGRRLMQPDVSLDFFRMIRPATAWADVVHLTGTYNWFLPLVVRASRDQKRPFIVSPRGSLQEVARKEKSVKKRLYDSLFQRSALHDAAAFHATSSAEARGILSYLPGARVRVIPNGIDSPFLGTAAPGGGGHHLLFLGRLVPFKRLELILHAFASAIRTQKDVWSLWMAGGGAPEYRGDLTRLTVALGLNERVEFLGRIEGAERTKALRSADALVLASKSENFGMVVAEALAHATPCLVTKTAPWEGLESEGCGFWVDDSEEALSEGMRRIMALTPDERKAMGERGRTWMARDFSWESAAKRMLALYEEVIQEKKPDGQSR